MKKAVEKKAPAKKVATKKATVKKAEETTASTKAVSSEKKKTSLKEALSESIHVRIASVNREAIHEYAKKHKMKFSTCISQLLLNRWQEEDGLEVTGPLAGKRKPKANMDLKKDISIRVPVTIAVKKRLQKEAKKAGITASAYLLNTIYM